MALASGERFVPVTPTGWLLLVGLALISQTAGQSLIAYALAHLPDVAREAQRLAPFMEDVVDHWRPVPDYEDEPQPRLFAAGGLPGPADLDPLTIEPMTAADDTNFVDRIKANPNVPQWVKDAL